MRATEYMAASHLVALLAIALGATAPAAFGDHQTADVSHAPGSSVRGCETTAGCFLPPEASIDAGGEVRWTNGDTATHTVVGGVPGVDGVGGMFRSGSMPPGASFSHTFAEPGFFSYYCELHPWMFGAVLVSESGVGFDPGHLDDGMEFMDGDADRGREFHGTANVTAAERGLGTFVDRWTFTVNVTNTGHGVMDVALHLGTNASNQPSPCVQNDEIVLIQPNASESLTGCFFVPKPEYPTELRITDWTANSAGLVPFTADACDNPLIALFGDATCLPRQSLESLVGSNRTGPAADPPVLAAAHYRPSGDLVLEFDAPVAMAAGWRGLVGITANNGTHSLELDGLGNGTGILTPQPGRLVWISLDDGDRAALNLGGEMRISMGPGAVLGPGAVPNIRISLAVGAIGAQ